MKGFIEFTVRLIRAGRQVYARKWSFFGVFAIVFLGSVFVLGQLELLPERPSTPAVVLAANPRVATNESASMIKVVSELPMKIEISKLNRLVDIMNPTTTVVVALDTELQKGAVRHPLSAKLGEEGNIVLFGHSSYLPIVRNQAYKAFNDIQKLSSGDLVTVYSSGTAYTYRVKSVAKQSAKSDEGISLEISGRMLTLVTCNSFGTKEDRFVVTADFVESHPAS